MTAYIELETKDCFLLACLFLATDKVLLAILALIAMLISSRNDQKKKLEKTNEDQDL